MSDDLLKFSFARYRTHVRTEYTRVARLPIHDAVQKFRNPLMFSRRNPIYSGTKNTKK